MHISSLPSEFGIGDLGPSAYAFVDYLNRHQQSYWQTLPLNPTDPFCGNSPYSSNSSFAYNTLFISPERLKMEGYIEDNDLPKANRFKPGFVDYDSVVKFKDEIFERAFKRFKTKKNDLEGFENFKESKKNWLNDYALFLTIKQTFNGQSWIQWPEKLKQRDDEALKKFSIDHYDKINKVKFLQYLFWKQWQDLKRYCKSKNIKLIGDMPIYVMHDSVDTWKDCQLFKLNKNKKMSFVAGVPPDFFSRNGQRWGNPVYHWDNMKKKKFSWWIHRFEESLNLFDIIRIDHFRGLIKYWEIPERNKTAKKGKWVNVPSEAFFKSIKHRWPSPPIIVEDLGYITDDVRMQIKRQGFAGMKVLLFAFNGNLKDHPYLPHNYNDNCVVYTGTHDNNTVRGWYENEATEHEKNNLSHYLKRDVSVSNIHNVLIEVALNSSAKLAIIPMQDIMGLDHNGRMNFPSKARGSWSWQMNSLDDLLKKNRILSDMTQKAKRI